MPNVASYCFPQVGGGLPRFQSESQHELEEPPAPGTRQRRGSRAENRSFTWKRLVTAYWTDWILILALWIILLSISRIKGYRREFSLRDISIQHTFAVHERVPNNLLVFVSTGVPLIGIIPVALFIARNAWDVHNALCGLFMSLTMTGVITQVIKLAVGRPRPDLIARCLPQDGAHDHPVFGLSTYEICTQTDFYMLNDGFKFPQWSQLLCVRTPAQLTTVSFAGVGYLTYYLAGKMHLWDAYGNRNRAWFALSPLLLGAMVAISRTEDNRHHWQDVLVGSLLGLGVAFVAYRTYYPHLAHPTCHLPMLPPSPEDEGSSNGEEVSTGVRLLSDDSGIPRRSEEEEAWRRG